MLNKPKKKSIIINSFSKYHTVQIKQKKNQTNIMNHYVSCRKRKNLA